MIAVCRLPAEGVKGTVTGFLPFLELVSPKDAQVQRMHKCLGLGESWVLRGPTECSSA